MPTIKVLLTDDHEIVLDSLSLLISMIEDIEVVGTLSDSRKVYDFLANNAVDVLLSDLNMPHLSGIDLTLQVRQHFPHVKVLMLTVSENADEIRAAFRAGISGYVMKKAGKAELAKALKSVADGNKYFSEAVMQQLMAMPADEPAFRDETPIIEPVALTFREIEIIRLIAQELSTSEIADKLYISVGTVETHRHNILRKLGVKNVIGIIKYAMLYKII